MLLSLMERELAVTRELLDLLQHEYTALRARDPAALQTLVDAKSACTERLQEIAGERLRFLVEGGFSADAAGLQAAIAANGTEGRFRLHAVWSDLTAVAERAWQQNTVNGAVISASRSNAERALAILRGQDTSTCLYGQNARASYGSSGGSRSLVKA